MIAQALRGGDYFDRSAGWGPHFAALARHHVRLGCLSLEMRLSRRAVYRSLCPREPVQADMTVLSVADRLATRDGPPNVTLAGAGRPVKAWPERSAMSQGWIRVGYQAATGGPWA